ncbi:MAG: radical SAM protein [Elusimicrobia bacterium]|nr:radical SAM protein [Elusimicrobiota bacterium]
MKAIEVLLSYACNEACAFCSQDIAWRRAPGLPFALVARELFKAAKEGYGAVCFSGGEPTLRGDLGRMLALSRKLGFEYRRVQTNGLRLGSPDYAAELAAAGATHFRVSLHGHDAAAHDALVKVPGAFAKAAAGLEDVMARGLAVGVNFVLTAENAPSLPAFCSAFLERGVKDFVLIYPLFEGDLVAHEGRMRIGMPDAAAAVRRAWPVFERAGAARPHLLNFTPCAAPELTPWMLAWSPHSILVLDAAGRPVDLYMASHDDRLRTGPCGACALSSECLGFKRSWLERFPGGGGLGPVDRVPEPGRRGARILRRGTGLFDAGRHEVARAVQPVAGQAPSGAGLRVERMTVTLDGGAGRVIEERAEWLEPLGEASHA